MYQNGPVALTKSSIRVDAMTITAICMSSEMKKEMKRKVPNLREPICRSICRRVCIKIKPTSNCAVDLKKTPPRKSRYNSPRYSPLKPKAREGAALSKNILKAVVRKTNWEMGVWSKYIDMVANISHFLYALAHKLSFAFLLSLS